jgi:glycosyltransferase involved in cell wall biosynthesis
MQSDQNSMRKIAYTLLWSADWGSGILKKVVGQVRPWIETGYDVHMFMVAYGREDDIIARVRQINPAIRLSVRSCRSMLDRIIQYQRLLPLVMAWNPDIIYHRFAGYFPAVATLARHFPTVFEINTDDLHEYALDRRYRHWYNLLTRDWLLSRGQGMVYISGDFAKLPHFARFGQPSVIIGNGIDLSLYEPLPAPANEVPRLVYIGSPHQPWHGVDKIVTLAVACPEWQFDIIGSKADEVGHRLPPNVQMHGFLARKDYEPLFAQADVALGTLALHRNGFNESSPLKNGEYLAFGLPLVVAHHETNFPQPPPFILQIPNTPDNVLTHLDDIRQFVRAMRGVRVPRNEIAHLDVHQKEQQRLAFFQQVIEQA